MPRFGRRRSTASRKSSGRNYEWIDFWTADAVTLPAGTHTAYWALGPEKTAELYDEPTLMRTLVNWQAHAYSFPTAGQQIQVGIGLIHWQAQTDLGAGDYPLPITTGIAVPWIWNVRTRLGRPAGSNLAITFSNGDEDRKSRRKLENTEGLLVVYECSADSDIGCDIWANFRCLLLNH